MSMKIKIWGSRGSLPAPYPPDVLQKKIQGVMSDFFEQGFQRSEDIDRFMSTNPLTRVGGYGGNTPCIEVIGPHSEFIIDGGSGIRLLGYELMNGPCGKGKGEVDLFFTHFHWDHLIGLLFFTPIFIPGNVIRVHSVQPHLKAVFQTLFKKPFFPVPLDQLGAKIEYHQLQPRVPLEYKDFVITPYELDHPDPCWGYKVECNGRVYSHCVDTECKRVTREELGVDLPLYQGVDLMIFDAQYSLMETIEKIDWGHAAASLGLDIGMREGIKRMIFMHHDPASSDDKILKAESEARRYYESQQKSARRSGIELHEVDWGYAHDGMEVSV